MMQTVLTDMTQLVQSKQKERDRLASIRKKRRRKAAEVR